MVYSYVISGVNNLSKCVGTKKKHGLLMGKLAFIHSYNFVLGEISQDTGKYLRLQGTPATGKKIK